MLLALAQRRAAAPALARTAAAATIVPECALSAWCCPRVAVVVTALALVQLARSPHQPRIHRCFAPRCTDLQRTTPRRCPVTSHLRLASPLCQLHLGQTASLPLNASGTATACDSSTQGKAPGFCVQWFVVVLSGGMARTDCSINCFTDTRRSGTRCC